MIKWELTYAVGDVLKKKGACTEVIYWNVKKTLDLLLVQVHRNYMTKTRLQYRIEQFHQSDILINILHTNNKKATKKREMKIGFVK